MRAVAALGAVLVVLLAPAAAGTVEPTPIHALRDDDFIPVPTPTTAAIVDPDLLPEPTLPPRPAPTSREIVVTPPPVQPVQPVHVLKGPASWYCWPSFPSVCARGFPYGGSYAAAGPKLRAAICGIQSCTSWRGRTVLVNDVPVRLIDWCQCYWHQANEKLIDLYHNAWEATHASGGVTIRW